MKKIVALCVVVFISLTLSAGKKDSNTIKLPKPDLKNSATLMTALKNRQSKREFSKKALPNQEISNLLWSANGINRKDGKTTAPAIWNLDLYVALKDGVYLYDYKNHALVRKFKKDIRDFVGKQDFTGDAPVNLIYVIDYKDMTQQWIESTGGKDFYAANLVGYVSQNVYLYCAANNMATVVLAWFDPIKLKKALKLSATERVILTQPVGYPKK